MTVRALVAVALVWSWGMSGVGGGGPVLAHAQERRAATRSSADPDREARLAALRARAQQRIVADATRYSERELSDIEMRYRSTRFLGTLLPDRGARQVLEQLIAEYPRSNRAGCAVLELAQMAEGSERERYLRVAIAEHDDAWFENGAQVGPLARASLAMLYAGLDRLAEAERLARDTTAGSVDSTGAPLDEVLPALQLLRPPRE